MSLGLVMCVLIKIVWKLYMATKREKFVQNIFSKNLDLLSTQGGHIPTVIKFSVLHFSLCFLYKE